MKMVSMKRGKREEPKDVPAPADEPYPWGLRITLEAEELARLEHSGDFRVGDKVSLQATARVKAVRASEQEGGEKSNSVELQIVELGLDEKAQLADEFAEKDED